MSNQDTKKKKKKNDANAPESKNILNTPTFSVIFSFSFFKQTKS